MRRSSRLITAGAALVTALAAVGVIVGASAVDREEEPFEERSYDSLYNHVIVSKAGDVVSFRRLENGATVSAIDLSRPARQVVSYTALLFAPLFFDRDPEAILSVGLGAGAINRLVPIAVPSAQLVTVEIDPMIVDLARRYTGFEETPRDRLVMGDGRRFLKRESRTWDWIVLDAFVKRSMVPPHLTTVEFYELVASRLAPDGVMVTNLPSGSRLFASHVATLRAVFSQVLFFRPPRTGNVVALCVTYPKPDLRSTLQAVDAGRLPDLRPYDVDLEAIRGAVVPESDRLIAPGGQVLTDDFAPVEYLEAQDPTRP